ncbi:MAG TPA: hypothetical protein VK525_04915 [Candidatus Saccharimonadales bacterium]|nr:hypothetical protein [Candidatus Saccharimonadales bacterium]
MPRAPKISRRQFNCLAAAAAASTLALPDLTAAPPGEYRQTGNVSGSTPEQAREVEAKLANIIRKYGPRLSAADREHLRKILAHNEIMLASVRAFALQNGDPTSTVLKVSVAEAAPEREKR